MAEQTLTKKCKGKLVYGIDGLEIHEAKKDNSIVIYKLTDLFEGFIGDAIDITIKETEAL